MLPQFMPNLCRKFTELCSKCIKGLVVHHPGNKFLQNCFVVPLIFNYSPHSCCRLQLRNLIYLSVFSWGKVSQNMKMQKGKWRIIHSLKTLWTTRILKVLPVGKVVQVMFCICSLRITPCTVKMTRNASYSLEHLQKFHFLEQCELTTDTPKFGDFNMGWAE